MSDIVSRMFQKISVPASMTAVSTMLSWAAEEVREDEGKNRGSVVDAIHEIGYGDDEDAAPWCARAVQAAWRIAGWSTMQRLDPRISRSGSVFYMLHSTFERIPSCALRCDYIGTDTSDDVVEAFCERLRPGDALIRYSMKPEFEDVLFESRRRSQTHKGHTEIVSNIYPDGFVDTVGGNTMSQTDSRDGDGVFIHSRMYNVREERVVGFVRPVFGPIHPSDE
jgi:hypothetical protein